MTDPVFAGTKAAQFLKSKGIFVAAAAAGAGGIAIGAARGSSQHQDASPTTRAGLAAHHAVGAGLILAGVGAGVYAAKGTLWKGGYKAATGAVEAGGKSFTAATRETGIANTFLKHPIVPTAIGMGLGGLVGAQMDKDNPAAGAAMGMVAGGAAGLALRSGRNMAKSWSKTPRVGKAALIAGAAIGVTAAAHAFTHEQSYAADDTAVSDGRGSYEATAGPRERMQSMNATGDLVFGLNARRH
jgi:hypothetical protein